jgi:hypothetical protein
MRKRNDLSCPECHHRLVYEDSFDPDTGKRDNAWYECSNRDCEYRCGADSLDVGQPTPARGFDESPTKLPLVTVPFHQAKLADGVPRARFLKGIGLRLAGGRRVEVWEIEGREGFDVRMYRPTSDGKLSEARFGLSLPAAIALSNLLQSKLAPRPLDTRNPELEIRRCLKCGCTDDCACDVTPGPGEAAATCSWVSESVDICSACLPEHLTPLFKEICLIEGMMEAAGTALSARVDAAHAILKGEEA